MKLSTSALSLLLLPLGILCSPVPEAEADPAVSGKQIFKRGLFCSIVNVSTYVNCRTGPSTNYPVYETIQAGGEAWFGCYTFGECIEDNWWV